MVKAPRTLDLHLCFLYGSLCIMTSLVMTVDNINMVTFEHFLRHCFPLCLLSLLFPVVAETPHSLTVIPRAPSQTSFLSFPSLDTRR